MSNIKIKRNITKLFICGGGFKFYYLYGTIKYLYEINILQNINEYIGISAGALLSLLFSIGYTPDELHKFFIEFNFERLIDPHIDNLLERKGLDDGEILKTAVQQLLIRKNIDSEITFEELYKLTDKKFVCVASNITKNELEILNYITVPNMPVWKGLLTTCALPLLFQPTIHNDNYLIDGGVFDNYPIELFMNKYEDNILGINLVAHCKDIDFNVDIINYMTKLFMISHHWKNLNKTKKYQRCTIEIKTYDSTEIMNTTISLEEKNRRILHGYDAAVNHFEKYEIQEKTINYFESDNLIEEDTEEKEYELIKELEEIEDEMIRISLESKNNSNQINVTNDEIVKKVSEVNYII